MRSTYAGLIALAVLPSSAAVAGPFTDDLSRCLVRSASADDRRGLIRWTFLIAAANPSLEGLAVLEDREDIHRAAAATYNRLILRDCRAEAIAAVRAEGPGALESSFQSLGEVAGREMMSSPEGMAEMTRLDRYLDAAGFEAMAREANLSLPGTMESHSSEANP